MCVLNVQQDTIAQQQLEKFFVVERGPNNILRLAQPNVINVLRVIHVLLFQRPQWLALLDTMLYLVKGPVQYAQLVLNALLLLQLQLLVMGLFLNNTQLLGQQLVQHVQLDILALQPQQLQWPAQLVTMHF